MNTFSKESIVVPHVSNVLVFQWPMTCRFLYYTHFSLKASFTHNFVPLGAFCCLLG